VAEVHGLAATYGPIIALRSVDFSLRRGEIVALMGRNGSGKSTLLAALVGLLKPAGGTVRVGGQAPYGRPAKEVVRDVGLVPQEPGDLLYAESVAAECAQADADAGAAAGTAAGIFERLAPGVDGRTHPRDLSEGQRLCLALSVILSAAPPLLLLDEPTRGLDYTAKARLVAIVRGLAAEGRAVVLATHDVELVAEVAARTVVLADGEVVADGPTGDVVTHSPGFAPQVAKVLAPQRWLTVDAVAKALAG
ncbi:MAG: ATP-binding cassette domain-containing protein, partial [Actinomycetota bacterium]|nr:ATP-binding cassette domain-containing protein [Actinomycetota bacterium]